jgi:hypothetical protein
MYIYNIYKIQETSFTESTQNLLIKWISLSTFFYSPRNKYIQFQQKSFISLISVKERRVTRAQALESSE